MIVWRREVGELLSRDALDEGSLDALMRALVAGRRCGYPVEVEHASPRVRDVLELFGLWFAPPVARSGVEMHRESEERKEIGVDVEVDPGDDAV